MERFRNLKLDFFRSTLLVDFSGIYEYEEQWAIMDAEECFGPASRPYSHHSCQGLRSGSGMRSYFVQSSNIFDNFQNAQPKK